LFTRGTDPLRKLGIPVLSVAAFLLLACVPALRAQKLTASPATAAASPEEKRKALNALFQDYWEDNLKHAPGVCLVAGRQAL